MPERVGTGVAVGRGVVGGAHAAGVEHHHGGPAHAPVELGARSRSDLIRGWKTESSSRAKSSGGA